MLDQRSTIYYRMSYRMLSLLRAWAFGVCVCSALSAEAEPTPISIDFEDKEGSLSFLIVGDGGVIKREQVVLSLTDERKTLLKIEILEASTERAKYWIKSFTDSKDDANIKGIMVRKDKNSDRVQIRVRYKEKIEHSLKDQITILEIPNGVKVIAPRSFSSSESTKEPTPSEPVSSPKPSLDPKLSKISSLSSSLSDEQASPKAEEARPSVFDRGTPVAPLPKMEQLRPTGVLTSNLGESGSSVNTSIVAPSPDVELTEETSSNPSITLLQEQPFKTASHLNEPKMQSLDVTLEKPAQIPQKSGSASFSKNPFDLDELSSLSAYIVLFLLLLWGASYFFKKGKALEGNDQGSSIKILSQKVVGMSPRQRIMVIETMGHTIVVGSCERGGLSHIAHLSTPQGLVGSIPFSNDRSMSRESLSSLDALSRFGGRDQYYADDGYPLDDASYQRSEPMAEVGVTYEENTFVGEDEVFTSELPAVGGQIDPMASADSYTHDSLHGSDQYADSSMSLLGGNDSSAMLGSTADFQEDDVNMKPGDLLQWIQKLNGTKG